jgi:glycopeptide antibiotics resistance protein
MEWKSCAQAGCRNKRIHLFLHHVLLPLGTGVAVYLLNGEPAWFMHLISDVTGKSIQPVLNLQASIAGSLIRNYGLDFLWSYAFLFCLYLFFGDDTALKKLVFQAAAVSLFCELAQKFALISGTFDVLDLCAEFLGIVLAAGIIHFLRRKQ